MGQGRRAGWLFAVATLLAASHASASPEDVFGFGPRSSAMAGTGTAGAEGYEAVYSNPALLSTARERKLTLGVMGASFQLHAATPIRYEPLRGSIIGAVLPIPFGGVLKNRIALGLGFFTPFDLVVRGRILYPETPQFLVADRTQSVAVQAGIGIDLGYGIRIGGGFAALAALSGNVLVASDSAGRVGTTVEDTLVASYGPIAGASVDLGDYYRIGATFRGTLQGRFDVVINVKDLGSIVVPPLNISGIAQYDPWQIAFEVARVRGHWRGAIGATYKHWSSYPGPAEATVRCPPLDVDGQPMTCAATGPAPPGYHDTVTARIGAERVFEPARGVRILARGGYFFEPSPAPEQTRESNQYDNARSVLSLGYGLTLSDPLPPIDFDLFGQLHFLHPRVHRKDDDIARTATGWPSAESGGTIAAVGATVGARF
jgi:long-chain fatty acid transport protein